MERLYTSFLMSRTPPKVKHIECEPAPLRASRLPPQTRPVDRKQVVSPMLSEEIKETVFGEKFREYYVRDLRLPNDPQYWTNAYLLDTGGCHLFTGQGYANCMAMGGWFM